MRHANKIRTLGRTANQRTALLRGLMVSLIRDGQILTTLAKAKEIQPLIERIVTFAKTDTVTSRRVVATRLGEPNEAIIKKIFTEIAPKFTTRPGGYTRVVKVGRTSPGRDEAVIAFVE
jgi:large subunit ribosomal protein L17